MHLESQRPFTFQKLLKDNTQCFQVITTLLSRQNKYKSVDIYVSSS